MSENSTTLFTLDGYSVMVIDDYYGYGYGGSTTLSSDFFTKYNPTYLEYSPTQAITQSQFIDRITKFVFGTRNNGTDICTNIIGMFADQKSDGEYKADKCMLRGSSDSYPTIMGLLTTLKPTQNFTWDNSLSGTSCMIIESNESNENKVLIPQDILSWPDEKYDVLYDVWKSVIRVNFGDKSNIIYDSDITNLRAQFTSGNIKFFSEYIPLVSGNIISTNGGYNLVVNKQSGVYFYAKFSGITFNNSLFEIDENWGYYYFTIKTTEGKKWQEIQSPTYYLNNPIFGEIYDSTGSNYCSYEDFLKISDVSLQIPIIYKGPFLNITLSGYNSSSYTPNFLKNYNWSFIFKNSVWGELYYPWSRSLNGETGTTKQTKITPYYIQSKTNSTHIQVRFLKSDIIASNSDSQLEQILIPCIRGTYGDIFYIGLVNETWYDHNSKTEETISNLTNFGKLEIYRCVKWKLSGNLRNSYVNIDSFKFNSTGVYEIPLSQEFTISCDEYMDINAFGTSYQSTTYCTITIPDEWVNNYTPEITINVNY